MKMQLFLRWLQVATGTGTYFYNFKKSFLTNKKLYVHRQPRKFRFRSCHSCFSKQFPCFYPLAVNLPESPGDPWRGPIHFYPRRASAPSSAPSHPSSSPEQKTIFSLLATVPGFPVHGTTIRWAVWFCSDPDLFDPFRPEQFSLFLFVTLKTAIIKQEIERK